MSVKINGSGIITGLDADGISAQPVFPGNVLQVVQASTTTQTNISSTSYQDSGLSASITPTSASSKILVFVNQQLRLLRAVNFILYADARILRDATSIFTQLRTVGGRAGVSGDGDLLYYNSFNGLYLDSPSTTSSVTYKTQGRLNTTDNSAALTFQDSSSTSTITLMEIAG